MQRWRTLTVGEVLDGLSRYKPFIATIAGVLLLAVILPGQARLPSGPDAGTAAAPIAGGGFGDPSSEVVGGSAEGVGSATSPRTAAEASLTGSGPRRVVGAATSSVAPPALGRASQSDALSAPDCDRETGRIKAHLTSWVTAADIIRAPNCVPIWPQGADNGGGTWRGVTRDGVKIALYQAQDSANSEQASSVFASAGVEDPTSDEEDDENRDKMIEAFEAHFETYGRHVEWVHLEASGEPTDDAAQKADAIRVAEEIKAFASLGSPSADGGNAYVNELSARGVLCIACTPTQPQSNFLRWRTVFETRMTIDEVWLTAARLIGSLAGKPAKWSSDAVFKRKDRVWGLYHYNTPDGAYNGSAQTLMKMIEPYGVRVAEYIEYLLDLPRAQEQARTMIAKMKDAGVTTLMCACDPFTPAFFTQEATRQRYFPEWMIMGGIASDWALFARTYDQIQYASAYGIAVYPARVEPEVAQNEGNLANWHFGHELTSYPDYSSLGILYTGMHLAGPVLNPDTFRAGLFSLKPSSGYLSRPAVSYGKGTWPWDDYHAIDDLGLIYWDPNQSGPDELGTHGQGMFRYLFKGKRFLPGELTLAEPPFFDPTNTVTVFPERPASDVLPRYEHKHYRHPPAK